VSRLTRAVLRRPVVVLVVWLLAVVALATQALQLEDRLMQPTFSVPGTAADRAVQADQEAFGGSIEVPVLLRGPEAEVERQGRRLVRSLRERAGVTAQSPFGGDAGPLRPSPTEAMVPVAVQATPEEAVEAVAPVRETVDAVVRPPVDAHMTGQAVLGKAATDASIASTRKAERLALPALAVVLLLVFGSVVAASIPALFGIAATISGFGLLSIVSLFAPIEVLATALASMMGLALGVDYSLLIVSRFREELDREPDSYAAAAVAAATAGRTVAFAGGTLAAAVTVGMLIAPGPLLLSSIIGVLVVTVVCALSALLVLPAGLALMGRRVDALGLPWARTREGGATAAFANRLTQRPAAVAAIVLVALLALAMPALGLKTSTGTVGLLPDDTRERQDYETIKEVMGPGWGAPFRLLVTDPGGGTMADRSRLRRLAEFQEGLADRRGVATVIGPGPLADRTAQVARLPDQVDEMSETLEEGRGNLRRLDRGLDEAGDGVTQVRSGLAEAAEGALALSRGSSEAASGAARLARGVRTAAEGSERLRAGLDEAVPAARRLARGASEARSGAGRLERGLQSARSGVEEGIPRLQELADGLEEGSEDLGRLREPVGVAERQLERAEQALRGMTIGVGDPRYAEALEAVLRARGAVTGRDPITGQQVDPEYEGLDASLAEGQRELATAAQGAEQAVASSRQLASGLRRLESGARELAEGLERLARGQRELAQGLERMQRGTEEAAGGMERLAQGGTALEGGVSRLAGGAGELARGLSSGFQRSGALADGIDEMGRSVSQARRDMPEGGGLERLREQAPGMLESGYMTLAALDGATRRERARVVDVINVDRGGGAARLMVIPTVAPDQDGLPEINDDLVAASSNFEDETGMRAMVGGSAAVLTEFERTTQDLLPLLIAGLSLITWIALIPLFRALLLPAVAVLLNLLTVAVAFGVMVLVFQGSDPLLGGPGYLAPVAVLGIFTVIFGLAIDYEIFLLWRMREGWVQHGDADRAIEHGLRHTARVVTGAAAIMSAVFIAFAVSGYPAIRQFGVGLTVAILLDATIVRLVLLPAVMRLLGPAAWWLPRWLDRILPEIKVDGRDAVNGPR
jgi:putative drug exporter of the RND superfamily